MAHKGLTKTVRNSENELICEPVDTYREILLLAQDPPFWKSLCKPLQPHSKKLIRNYEQSSHSAPVSLECPQTFCHFDPDAEEVERHDEKDLPKTLVCHDMANGYHDDSYIDGTPNYDAYTFYNWAGIDIFCYFSHHLLTIPPLAWINVGHMHGVKVIGTLITEWAEGVEFWDKALASEAEYQKCANALVNIAKSLQFDGWLLNVENKVSKPQELLKFVRYLHRALHAALPHAVLIWYDSVTIDGHLNWQNKLNAKNMEFFKACDGLFTNYSWSEDDVADSVEAADERVGDVFVGIDVWGRNFYGGGQFNVQEAVELVYSYGCSLALFAPAWTHEAAEEPDAAAPAPEPYERFLLRDRALWGSLWPFLNTRVPSELPFCTSFCRGQGLKRRLYGEVLCPGPWFNLRHQQYQPNAAHGAHGYLLSTHDKIAKLARSGVLSAPLDDQPLSEVFRASRMELHLVRSPDVSPRPRRAKAEDPPSVKRKRKFAFKNLFGKSCKCPSEENSGSKEPEHTTEKGHEEEKQAVETQDSVEKLAKKDLAGESHDNLDVTPSAVRSPAGRSMVQVSVNIKLNDAKEKVRYSLAAVPEELQCLEPFLGDSFSGGACLRLHPSDQLAREHRTARLLHCDFRCEERLVVCVGTKAVAGAEQQFLNLVLHCETAAGPLRCVLVGRDLPHEPGAAGPGQLTAYPASAQPGFRDLQQYLLLHQPDCYVSVENSYGWKIRYYELRLGAARVTSVNARCGLAVGAVLLGYLGLCARPQTATEKSTETLRVGTFDTAC